MIFRPESLLVYFNIDNVCDVILSRVRGEPTPPKLVVLDLSAAARVDMQSAHMLAGIADELTAKVSNFTRSNRVPLCANGSGTNMWMANWAA